MYRTLRTSELRKLSETNKTAASVLSSANTVFVPTAPERRVFRKYISAASDYWKNVNDTWQVELLPSEHGFKEIQNLIVERKMSDGSYKNILYSYNIYNKDTLVIIVDYRINVRITLLGIENILEIPEDPDVPDEPEDPDVPDEPEDPDVPDEPEDPDVPDFPDFPDFPEVEGGVFFPYNKNEDEIEGFGTATQDSAAEHAEGKYEVSFSIPANYVFGSFYMRDDGYEIMMFENGRDFFEYLKASPDQENTYRIYMNGVAYNFTAVYNSVTGHIKFTIEKERGEFHNCYFYSLPE